VIKAWQSVKICLPVEKGTLFGKTH